MMLSKNRRNLAVATFVLGMGVGLTTGVSSAVSPSQSECEDAGGTFTKVKGTVTCTFETSDPVGNSESSDGQTRDTTTTDSEQGNLSPKDKNATTSECSGPGSSSNC